jgi:hypothetical protein
MDRRKGFQLLDHGWIVEKIWEGSEACLNSSYAAMSLYIHTYIYIYMYIRILQRYHACIHTYNQFIYMCIYDVRDLLALSIMRPRQELND